MKADKSLCVTVWLCTCLCVAALAVESVPLALTAPRAASPPQIDGRLSPGEWDAAAAATGFSKLRAKSIAQAQPVFFVAFDIDAIFCAVRVPCPTAAKPVANVVKRDGPVWQDDSVEVFVAPTPGRSTYYHFVVNAAGVQRDACGMDEKWNAKWRAAAGRDGDAWIAEMSIPWRALGLSKPGKEVGFNVTWNCRTGHPGHYTWAQMAKSFHEPEHFARLRFKDQGPTLRVTGLTGWQTGKLRLAASVVGAATRFDARLMAGGKELEAQARTLGTATLSFALPMDGQFVRGGEYLLRYRCGDAASGELRFDVPAAVQLAVTQRMLAGFVDVQADLAAMGPRAAGGTLALMLAPEGPADEPVLPVGPTLKVSHTLDLRDRPVGAYRLTATAADREGRPLASASAPIRKPAKPEWLGCREGLSDEVLAPWTPVQAEGSQVKVWGRTYEFASGPLPSRITTRDKDVLVGPVRLVGRSNGVAQTWEGQPGRVVESAPDHATLSAWIESQYLRVEGRTRVEYDGMMLIDLRVQPKRPGATVSLALEVPLKALHAKYLYHFPGRWRSAFNVGALPAEGWTGPFKPYVWLGDDWRGLAWFCESDQHWRPAEKAKAVQIIRRGDQVCLRLDLLSQAKMDEPVPYTIGFEATPVKPLKPDVWDYRIVHSGRYGLEKGVHRPSGSITWPAQGNISLDRGTFECWVRPDFDPNVKIENRAARGVHNQNLFRVSFEREKNLCLYWNIDDRGMRAFVQTGRNRYPVLIGAANKWQRGEWHHVALTWGDEFAVHVDGREVRSRKYKGSLPDDPAHARIELGFARCEFVVDEMRISDVVREFSSLDRRLEADEHTLLHEQFDEQFKPDGETRTQAKRIAPGCKVNGGLPSGECAFVPGKFGHALALYSAGPPRSQLDQLADAGVRTICFHEHWTPIQDYHVPADPEALRSLVRACHERGIQLLLYWGYEISNIHPDWDVYHRECLVHPRRGGYHRKPEQRAYVVCYNSPWQDYIAWSIAKVMDEFDIDGVYLDGTAHAWACDNVHHGCGYVAADGKRHKAYGILAARQMMRRIYAIVKSRKPKGQVNVHNSTMMVIPSLGWATSTWDGEQFGGMVRGPHFDEVLPLDAFRTEFMGQQWGVPAEFLCYNRPYTQRESLAFTLLHDVLVRNARDASKLWRAMDKFGRTQARWLPYWENAEYVQTHVPHVKASLYSRGKEGLMMVVSNLGRAEADVRVTLALDRLGLAGAALQAEDALSRKPVKIDRGGIGMRLKPMEWRLIHVAPKRPDR